MTNQQTCCKECRRFNSATNIMHDETQFTCVMEDCACHTPQGEAFKENMRLLNNQPIYSTTIEKGATPYNQKDHSHCWVSKNPPCGHRLEHLKCCLCELPNPQVLTTEKGEWEEEFDAKFDRPISDAVHRHLSQPTSRDIFYDNTAIKSFIRTLKAKWEAEAYERAAKVCEGMTSSKYTWKTDKLRYPTEVERDAHNTALTEAAKAIRSLAQDV